MCHSSNDSEEQTSLGVKGPVHAPGTEGREEGAKRKDYESKKEIGRVKFFS
jgi:hypothetical protein